EAELASLQVQLQSQYLNQKAEAARVQSEYNEARMRAETDAELAKLGVISNLNLKISQGNSQQLATRAEIEQQRVENSKRELEARILAQKARVSQVRAAYALARTRLESMKVRAGSNGVLQELSLNGQPLQVGQQVQAGPTKLKAELKIPETQAKDVQLGQPSQVDTHNGVVSGKVIRIDPAVQNGTVTVDVALEGELPPGARPDLSVDGTIELERLASVLYVGRPAFG